MYEETERKKEEKERRRDKTRWDEGRVCQRSDGVGAFRLHVALAPSVGLIRQQPTTILLLACTPVGLGEMLSCNTISLFDRSAIPTVTQSVEYQFITAK